jgi:hypothetical protein
MKNQALISLIQALEQESKTVEDAMQAASLSNDGEILDLSEAQDAYKHLMGKIDGARLALSILEENENA